MLGDVLWYRIWVIEALKTAIIDAGMDPEFFLLLQRDASLRNDSRSFFFLHNITYFRKPQVISGGAHPPVPLP